METPDTPLIGHVWVDTRRTRRGLTYYLRWRDRVDGRVRCRRRSAGITVTKPVRSRDLHLADARARVKAADLAAELGDASAAPTAGGLRNHVRMRRIADAVSWHLAETEGKRSAATLAARSRILDGFLAWVREHTAKGPHWRREPIARPSQLSNGDLAAWAEWSSRRTTRQGRAPAPNTLVTELGHLEAWLRWCWDCGLTHEHLTMRRHIEDQQFRARRGTPGRPKRSRLSLEDDQLRDILDRAPTPRKRTILRFTAATGLRSGEVYGALAADWDPERATLSVVGKGGKERTIPLGTRTNASIIELRTHHFEDEERLIPWLSMSSLGSWLRREPITPHDLRRWFSTTLLRAKCPPYIRKLLMGHAIGATDDAYMLAQAYRVSDGRPWVQKVEDVLDGKV